LGPKKIIPSKHSEGGGKKRWVQGMAGKNERYIQNVRVKKEKKIRRLGGRVWIWTFELKRESKKRLGRRGGERRPREKRVSLKKVTKLKQ